MTAGSSIDYDALTQDALRGVVRAVLTQVAGNKAGLPGDHHFYIAFNTQAPGVSMSRRLKEKYPEEMMIVLQHRFWDLLVSEEAFEVKLSFDGIPERLCIPFDALKVFFDPSVRFTLQFGDSAAGDEAPDSASGRRRRPGDDSGRSTPGGTDKRSRARNRLRAAENGDEIPTAESGDEAAATKPPGPHGVPQVVPQVSPPAIFSPRAVEPTRSPASVQPVPAATKSETSKSQPAQSQPQAEPVGAEPSVGEPTKPAGAKVFSLDQFRNKK